LQFVEDLPDRQAADAVRSRIDWKYALSLELSDPGFDFSVLSEFRHRLVAGQAEELLLNQLLERLQQQGLLKHYQRQRTDSTHVLAAVRKLNRLETLGETLRAALNSLSVAAPDWLSSKLHPDWIKRYGRRVENYRMPKTDPERATLGSVIGADGLSLLTSIEDEASLQWLREIPAVEVLRRVWIQQFYAPGADGTVLWRLPKDMPPSTLAIHSPYDVEAHYSNKRSVEWVGYKVHMSEVCTDNNPHVITHVHTTFSTVTDETAVDPIHQALSQRSLLPDIHLMDGGYMTAEHLVNSQTEYKIEVIGPVRSDPSWQARQPSSFALEQFQIDWDSQVATCPMGHPSITWSEQLDMKGKPIIDIRFPHAVCRNCPVRGDCTRAKTGPRGLTIRAQAQHRALQERRQDQLTPEFQKLYNQRAGVEAIFSQGSRRAGVRRSRYIGLDKAHLQNLLIATALNLVRVDAWLEEVPFASTRASRFLQLWPKSA
jgi:transposase